MSNENVRERLLRDHNIYLAVHMVNSYILNKELLDKKDRESLQKLSDTFDCKFIEKTISEVRNRLEGILTDDNNFFTADVYFKPKKFEDSQIFFRPLHTAPLIDQIAMTAILQILIYRVDSHNKLVPSELSRLLPASFYGNRVSYDGKQLFKPWQEQYRQYTDKANDCLYAYAKTGEYRYEVDLDLKNFFPSISPEALYGFILDKLPLSLSDADKETTTILIRKLLIFRLGTDNRELNPVEIEWYLGKAATHSDPDRYPYVKGIPQGLPHTYFLANLYMLIVKQIYQEHIPGKAFFYVDDSILFTNGGAGELNDGWLEKKIGDINTALCEANAPSSRHSLKMPGDWCYKAADFVVKVHDTDGKSSFAPIREAMMESGEPYLRGMCREVSKVGFDWYSAFSDEEIVALRKRMTVIYQAIIAELGRAGSDKQTYREKLMRYRKYFGYRVEILEYLSSGDINTIASKLINDIQSVNSNNAESLEHFFDAYADDILAAVLHFVRKKECESGNVSKTKLGNAFQSLVKAIYKSNINHAYLQKDWDACALYAPADHYRSLCEKAQQCYHPYQKLPMAEKYAMFLTLVHELSSHDMQPLYSQMKLQPIYDYSALVRSNNEQLDRMLLNAIFSSMFCFETSDSIQPVPTGRGCLEYAALRVLASLRNHAWTLRDFVASCDSMMEDNFRRTADYSILQVIDIFQKFVGAPESIDKLIQIHKYCEDTWKNGSKYLYFYTIHNQEHAVNLIKSVVKVVHSISKFQMKPHDYFLVFAACYLHDISMVSMPNYSHFYLKDDTASNQIYSNCKRAMKESNSIKAKKGLCDCSRDIDAYYENQIRSHHAQDSAGEIRKHPELNFTDSPTRDLIATISEMHGANCADVYFRRSGARKELVNLKVASILLRLADLLDISRYRVSPVLLAHNMDDMNATSRFHWISHLLTDGYQLETDYMMTAPTGDESYIRQKGIVEQLTLTVNVLMPQTTAVHPNEKCKGVESCTLNTDGKTTITMDCKYDADCNQSVCPFLCRWFTAKNEYLLSELAILHCYLDTLPDYFFKPAVKLSIQVSGDIGLSNSTFDYLKEYVDRTL